MIYDKQSKITIKDIFKLDDFIMRPMFTKLGKYVHSNDDEVNK